MTVSSVISYLGEGLAAARPANPGIPVDTLGFYYATDTLALSLWNGSAWVGVGGGAGSGSAFSYTLAWGAGSFAQDGTIEIDGGVPDACHFLDVVFSNGTGGSTTGDFQINGASITGLSAIVNNTSGTASATGLNAAVAGDKVRVVLSSSSNTMSDGSYFTLQGTID